MLIHERKHVLDITTAFASISLDFEFECLVTTRDGRPSFSRWYSPYPPSNTLTIRPLQHISAIFIISVVAHEKSSAFRSMPRTGSELGK